MNLTMGYWTKISLSESQPLSAAADITIATPSLLMRADWTTKPALSSDHIPIDISIKWNVVIVNDWERTYVNFSKANWASFREYLKEEVGSRLSEPQDIHISEKHFLLNIYQKSDQIFPPMNVMHYVSLIQTINVSRHYRQGSRRWWGITYEQNREHT